MSSNKHNTPRPVIHIPEYPYEKVYKNDDRKLENIQIDGEKNKNTGQSKLPSKEKHPKGKKRKYYVSFSNSHIHIDDRTPLVSNESNQNSKNNQYYVLHSQDPPDRFSHNFFRVKHIVRYGILFDMVAAFLFFVFNPYFLFFSFFNLLFVYLGWHGVQTYDSSYLGSYAIYMFMKIISMIGFFVYVCANISSYFHNVDSNDNSINSTFIWFCSTYSFSMCLYIYFYINTMKFIKLLLD